MAKSKKEIEIVLGTTGISSVKKDLSGIMKSIDGITKSVFAGAASFYTLKKALDIGIKLGDIGSKVQDLTSAYNSLTKAQGLNAKVMLDEMNKGVKGTVNNLDLLQQANNALLLKLPVTEQDMGLLAEAGRRLGKAMGVNAKMGLESLVVGIGRQSKLWLDNLGIIIDTEEAYKKYADKIKTTSDKLTDQQKKLAFYEEAIKSTREKLNNLGEDQLTFNDYLDQSTASLNSIVQSMATDFAPVMKDAAQTIGNFAVEFKELNEMFPVFEYYSKIASYAMNSFIGSFKTGINFFSMFRKELKKGSETIKNDYNKAMFDLIKEVESGIEKSTESIKKLTKNSDFDEYLEKQKLLIEQKEKETEFNNIIISQYKDIAYKMGLLDEELKKRQKFLEVQADSIQLTDEEIKKYGELFEKIIIYKEKFIELFKLIGTMPEPKLAESNYMDQAIQEIKNKYDAMTNYAQRFENIITGSFYQMAINSKTIFTEIGENFKNMLVEMVAELAAKSIIFSFLNLITGGVFGLAKTGIKGMGGIGKYLLGFQHGGSFQVAGSGGVDSKIVAFRATPGERVTISKPNQNISNNPVINIYTQSVDENFVRTKLMPTIQRVMINNNMTFA